MSEAELKTTALFQWFGSNRLLAKEVGRELDGCEWVGIPFAGGMCELAHIKARSLVVNDLHREAVNCASVVADPELGPQLYRRLRRLPFHPDVLARAQENCRSREVGRGSGLFHSEAEADFQARPAFLRLAWAEDYFVSVWMGRGGHAGTAGEYNGSLSARWDAGGGDSAVRFRSATTGLPTWRRIMSRCTFLTMDALEFIASIKDRQGHGIYCDAPFPGPGDGYKHTFSEANHRQLARELSRYGQTRVCCRFYDHPLVCELYPESRWTWRRLSGGKDRANKEKPEVLLLNGPSYAV